MKTIKIFFGLFMYGENTLCIFFETQRHKAHKVAQRKEATFVQLCVLSVFVVRSYPATFAFISFNGLLTSVFLEIIYGGTTK